MEESTNKKLFHRYTKEQKAAYIQQWRESGRSKKAFCEANALNYFTFSIWTNAGKTRKHKEHHSDSPGFFALRIKESEGKAEVGVFAEVRTADKFIITLYKEVAPEYLRKLVRG